MLDLGSKFLLCTQFDLFSSQIYFCPQNRQCSHPWSLENAREQSCNYDWCQDDRNSDGGWCSVCKNLLGTAARPAPGPGLIGYHLCPVTVWRILKCNYVLLRDVCGTWSSFCLHSSSIHFESWPGAGGSTEGGVVCSDLIDGIRTSSQAQNVNVRYSCSF